MICAACRWEGERVFVSCEDPISRREGFGRCPRCDGALVHKPPRYGPGRSKLASLPANGLR